ncbi:MAG: bifunctional nuclease family protein [Chloroflexi bacterium]|nr:bifunctional nuclease family protein [Chloroflexota bacterium]
MLEMVIDSIRVSLLNYQRVVILKEKNTDRYLPIWIGPDVADAIAVKLQEVSVPRPLTHDLLQQVVQDLGASFNYIVVSGLDHDTFFAKIVLTQNGKTVEVDSRPSDALALAVRAKVPIYAEESVLEKAGVHLDKESGKAVVGSEGEAAARGPKPVDEKELQSMSAFKDFIESLNLDELGGKGGDGEKKPDKPDK